jgi:glutamine amidotransferase
MTSIAILDYGMGNLRSVEKALERVGAEVRISSDAEDAAGADGLVLPGVGAFPKAMELVRRLGFERLVRERAEAGVSVLGICLGVQLLFESSTEHGGGEGIGVLEGEVTALQAPGLKVPHMGWEPVRWEAESGLAEGLGPDASFYFVHSFAVRPANREDVLATAEWGERFACAIARPPLYGVQFHPEKSSADGLRLLGNFAALCSRTAAVG